jgi:hypothetical protein
VYFHNLRYFLVIEHTCNKTKQFLLKSPLLYSDPCSFKKCYNYNSKTVYRAVIEHTCNKTKQCLLKSPLLYSDPSCFKKCYNYNSKTVYEITHNNHYYLLRSMTGSIDIVGASLCILSNDATNSSKIFKLHA